MRKASIHRNEHTNQWVLVIRDTIREKTIVRLFDSLVEAEQSAAKDAQTVRIALT